MLFSEHFEGAGSEPLGQKRLSKLPSRAAVLCVDSNLRPLCNLRCNQLLVLHDYYTHTVQSHDLPFEDTERASGFTTMCKNHPLKDWKTRLTFEASDVGFTV